MQLERQPSGETFEENSRRLSRNFQDMLHRLKFFVDALHRKSHDIEVTPLESRTADVPDPFLDAVGSCLVKRLVMVNVILDFLIRKDLEGHLGCHGKLALSFTGRQAYTRHHMMRLAAQHLEHANGIFRITGFPKNDPSTFLVVLLLGGRCDDHCVGGQNQKRGFLSIRRKQGAVGLRLFVGDVLSCIVRVERSGIAFVDTLNDLDFERQVQTSQEFLSARRIARQNNVI